MLGGGVPNRVWASAFERVDPAAGLGVFSRAVDGMGGLGVFCRAAGLDVPGRAASGLGVFCRAAGLDAFCRAAACASANGMLIRPQLGQRTPPGLPTAHGGSSPLHCVQRAALTARPPSRARLPAGEEAAAPPARVVRSWAGLARAAL